MNQGRWYKNSLIYCLSVGSFLDANGDGIISVAEAQPAALEFKQIADGDGDGRVTPYEYERAREFIIARY